MGFGWCDLEPSSPVTFRGKLGDFPVDNWWRTEPARYVLIWFLVNGRRSFAGRVFAVVTGSRWT
jgi:hypothetical protein